MRIRKRQPPLPLSSLSPLPLSDPHSHQSPPVVQLHNSHDPQQYNLPQLAHTASSFHPQMSDQPNQPIGTGSNGFNCSDNQEKKDCLVLQRKEHDKGVEEEKSNDSRKKNMLGAEVVSTGVVSESSCSQRAFGRWCEEEKAFPLKKRRGNLERKANQETIVEKDNKKMKTKMKTKMNKKFGLKDDDHNEHEEGERKENGENNSAKKRGRGGALMEGSRCSRVNGRGWRCCQQTLVGYSLCEHHLGKGRLRSMTSVRSRALGTSAPNNNESTHTPLSTNSLSIEECKPKREVEVEDEDDEKPLMITAAKKRMKLGMVKARSISSLLGQTNKEITVSDK
ncbi:hypothetical protein ACOSQ3_029148 [Xanthoceras sorbifolium]